MSSFMENLTQDILVSSILLVIIGIVGLVGNGLMLRALVQYKQLRTSFYTVFGCLSVVDSWFIIIAVPAHIMDMVHPTTGVTDAWCKGSQYMTSTCGFIAAYLLVVLSVLRGIMLTNRNAVLRPQACHLLTVCIALCILTLLCSIPIMFPFTSYSGTDGIVCDFVDPLTQQSRHVWLISAFSTFIPLALAAIIYFMTYMLGKRYFADSYSPREKQKSRLVSALLIAFTICQTPYRVATIYELYMDQEDMAIFEKMYMVKNYLMCLLMVDKAVRPILYTKVISDLSEVFEEVINCVYCSKHYSMGSRFRKSAAACTSPSISQNTATTLISSTDSNLVRATERTVSSSSSASATSQTPLTCKENDPDMYITVLQG